MQNYKHVYGGIPFVDDGFNPVKLLTLAAITRKQISKNDSSLDTFIEPDVACEVYENTLDQVFREKSSIEMPADKVEIINDCLIEITREVPSWKDMFSLPIEYRLLTNNQTSLTNPLAPQVIYIGEQCFTARNILKEILVHEYSHIWCAMMCEIQDFQKPNSPADMYLPSGTGPKDARGMLLAGLFAVAAINYYESAGLTNTDNKVRERVAYLTNYFKETIESLIGSESMTTFGVRIVDDLRKESI